MNVREAQKQWTQSIRANEKEEQMKEVVNNMQRKVKKLIRNEEKRKHEALLYIFSLTIDMMKSTVSSSLQIILDWTFFQ